MARFWRAPRRRWLGSIVSVTALALLTTACGRAGDPLPPPSATAAASPKASSDPATGGLGMARPDNPPIQRPDKPFFLDPLIK